MAVINPHAQGQIGTNSSGVWPTGQQISNLPYHHSGTVTQIQPSTTVMFTVEREDNGFIVRSGRNNGDIAKTRVCSSIEEVKDLFVAVLVEYQLEK